MGELSCMDFITKSLHGSSPFFLCAGLIPFEPQETRGLGFFVIFYGGFNWLGFIRVL